MVPFVSKIKYRKLKPRVRKKPRVPTLWNIAGPFSVYKQKGGLTWTRKLDHWKFHLTWHKTLEVQKRKIVDTCYCGYQPEVPTAATTRPAEQCEATGLPQDLLLPEAPEKNRNRTFTVYESLCVRNMKDYKQQHRDPRDGSVLSAESHYVARDFPDACRTTCAARTGGERGGTSSLYSRRKPRGIIVRGTDLQVAGSWSSLTNNRLGYRI